MFARASLFLLVLCCLQEAFASEYSLPDRVEVLPVAFVPKNEKAPTADHKKLYLRHIQWTRDRYRELLGDTFELAKQEVQVVSGAKPLDFYRKQPEGGAPDIVAELLNHFHVTRFNCPHVYAILLMNAKDSFPEGGGRSINGGFNTGGGMFYVSSWNLTHRPNFQSTIQHEMAHSFGLPHVDVYGYDMKTNPSIMSYNPTHHTKEFSPSSTPAVFIPEDRRGLALNDKVLINTTFDPARDIPSVYLISKRIVTIGPMTLPGHPDFYPQISTSAGEAHNSKVVNIVREQIKPSQGPGVNYDASTMWHSKQLGDNEKAVLEITFPTPVRLTGIAIHSQHSGQYNEATAVSIKTNDANSGIVVDQPLAAVDDKVTFPETTAARWSILLTAGTSHQIVIRGLRFFDGAEEICPHMVPY